MLQRLDPRPQPADAVRSRPARRIGPLWRWLATAVVVIALGSGALALLSRSGAWLRPAPWNAGLREIAAVLVFFGTYGVVAIGKLPGFHIDRAGAALLGASLMVGCGALTLEEAYRAIDLDTITLLLGMMIVIANLRLSGYFRLVGSWAVTRAHHPALLLSAIVLVTGVLSAFLVNDAICLVMTPLVIELTRALKRTPVPYLLAVAMASNVGSTTTITGNPQNMIIGSLSRIPYGTFATALAPVAGVGLALTIALIVLFHTRSFFTAEQLAAPTLPARVHRGVMLKSAAVTLAMVALFFAGQPVAKVA